MEGGFGEGGVEVDVSTHIQDYTCNIFTLQTTFQHEQCGQRQQGVERYLGGVVGV